MDEANLIKELSIPSNATLEIDCKFNPSLSVLSSGASIAIAKSASLNKSVTFLLIGRQANVADIRIDHKSISRKHASLYFIPASVAKGIDEPSPNGGGHDLILKDLGGKYGCTVNGNRLDKGSNIALKDGDSIIFGNVREQIFNVKFPKLEESVNENRNRKAEGKQENQEVLTGREAREAEIAAMTDSLDHMPSYTKFQTENIGTNASLPDRKEDMEESSNLNNINKRIPIKENIRIPNPETSNKSKSVLVTTISLDPSGSRLMAGISDGTMRLYDFNGMDLSLQPFRTVSIQDGRYSIVSATFSCSGDRILIGSTSAQPVVLDRDGYEIKEFAKGDMYVTDMLHTDGHVANVTAVDWHPFDREIVLTASIDGSVRIWDLERGKSKFSKLCSGKSVYRIKSSMGKKTRVTSVTFSPTGREFACGTSCGSIQIWNASKVGSRPDKVVYNAHGIDVAIHSVTFNNDAKLLASRCLKDDCVNVWDCRKLCKSAKPLRRYPSLKNRYEYSNVAFSPDGEYLCAGTSVEHNSQGEFSHLKIYKILGEEVPVADLKVQKNTSVIDCFWHKKLNQIILGLSDGTLSIYYDPNRSKKGALLPVSKGYRKQDELSLLLASRAPSGSAGINLADIQTPHALPMYRDAEKNTKRKREKERQDPIKSKRPDLPSNGIKAGEGTSAGLNFQQYNLTSAIQKNKNIAGKDPRDELFKYQEGKNYTKVHYDGDVKVLAEKTAEQEEEEHEE